MADLTRFDFNAHNFLNSETVESMSDAEIGQYIMLMAKSWVLAKDCSLPDDPKLLAKWAHCEKISPKVLVRFPIAVTNFGERRRNEVLYQEWLKALDRTNTAAENGRVGAAVRWGGYSNPNGDPNGKTITQTNPIIPSQTNPNQDGGNFKNIAVRYRRQFAVNLSHGTLQKDAYAEACRQFSEDVVLNLFDEWAPDNMWIKERRHTNGLRQFYDSLPAMVEADKAIKHDLEIAEKRSDEMVQRLEKSIEVGHAEFLKSEAELLAEREAEEKAAAGLQELLS